MRTLLIILLSLSCLAGLAQTETNFTKPPASAPYTFAEPPAQETNAAPAASAPDATTPPAASPTVSSGSRVIDDTHKLQPGDQVSFRIAEDRDAATAPEKILFVSDSGELDVPYIGLVKVSGKTCKQAVDEITAQVEKDYYYKATVKLGLVLASKSVGRVYVWGQVAKQGALEIPTNEKFTAGKAILLAGGFGEFAKKTKVKVIRTVDGVKKTFELNMEDILEKGQIEKDMTLEPDDFILVPERHLNM